MIGNYNKVPSSCPSWPRRRWISISSWWVAYCLTSSHNWTVQGLADVIILKVLDHNPIEPVDNDIDEDLDFSNEVDEQNDNNDEQDSD